MHKASESDRVDIGGAFSTEGKDKAESAGHFEKVRFRTKRSHWDVGLSLKPHARSETRSG